MTDYDCNPKDAQEYYNRNNIDPYEKKAFIGNKDCKLATDLSGHKYITWFEDKELYVSLYEYELEEMLNRVKQYKGE